MDIKPYISLNCAILSLVGLYPKNGTRSLTVAFFMLLIVVPQVVQIYQSRDLGVILETSSVLLTIILALLKMIVWTARRTEIDDLITYMFGDYWNMARSGGKAQPCFIEYATYARSFTRCYLFLVVNALLLFYGLPLIQTSTSKKTRSINETRAFLFPAMYPEGWTESPIYEVTLFSQAIATCSCGAVVLAIDTLVAMTLFYTCGHFKIVQENLTRLSSDHVRNSIYDPVGNELLANPMKRDLAANVKHHQITLMFSEAVEHLFSPIMLCQVLASNLIICLVGLQVSSTFTDQGKILKYFSYLLMTLFQLILFCLPGDDLINRSLAVSDAAYSMNWYMDSEPLKFEVQFIIARGQKPAKITAGKFNVMSLEHFGMVLSTAMSYFTVLRSLS